MMVILLIKRHFAKNWELNILFWNGFRNQDYLLRSSSGTKREMRFPYRLCLAGGWIDQPWVSKIHPGSVVVAQIWPTMDFNDRSGLATSSRNVAIKLWGDRYPDGDHEENARLLFGAENPPGKKYISGSQDHIGLLYPGINRLYYRVVTGLRKLNQQLIKKYVTGFQMLFIWCLLNHVLRDMIR